MREATDGEAEAMMAIDISTLLKDSGFERVSILKIDIEGAEKQVFALKCEEWLPETDNLGIELPDAASESIFHRAIAEQGFDLSRCEELLVCRRRVARTDSPTPATRNIS